MNLVVDVGNTVVKSAVFNRGELITLSKFPIENYSESLNTLLNDNSRIAAILVSSVGRIENSQFSHQSNDILTIFLNAKTQLPFTNLYETPGTLGVDRLALVSAAVTQFAHKNVLIIDVGTCVTYDFVDAEKNYYGGAISPGLRLRYQSLNNFTANLPLLDTKVPQRLIGNSTTESIHSGVVNGLIMEIDGAIDRYKSNYSDLTIILTGGDSDFLSDKLKNSIFANSNFLLEGLNHILEYNSDK